MSDTNCEICGKEISTGALRGCNMFGYYIICDEHYEFIENAVTDLIETLAKMYTLSREEI